MYFIKKITPVMRKSYLFIVFVMMVMIIYLTISQQKNVEIKRFYRKINHAFKTLDTWQAKVLKYSVKEFLNFFYQKDVTAWVYVNENLTGWSGNQYPEPDKKILKESNGSTISFVSNGWDIIKKRSKKDTIFLIQLPIYLNYTFRNDFVQPHFSSFFQGIRHLAIKPPVSHDATECLSIDAYGVCLPFVYEPGFHEDDPYQWIMPMLLYVLVFLLFSGSRKYVHNYVRSYVLKVLFIIVSTFFIWFTLHLVYSIPVWKGLIIKQPHFFAWSIRLPSLADLLNVLMAFFWFTGLTLRLLKNFQWVIAKKEWKYFVVFLCWTTIWLFMVAFYVFLPAFFHNSSWYWNFKDLTTFDLLQIWLFFTVLLASTVIAIFWYHASNIIQKTKLKEHYVGLIFVLSGSLIFVFTKHLIFWQDYLVIGGFLILAYLLLVLVKMDQLKKTLLLFFALVIFSFLVVLSLRKIYHEKLKQNLKILSLYLSSGRDHLAEYLIDETLQEFIQKSDSNINEEIKIRETISQLFKKGYLSNFSSQLIVCSSQDKILIRPFNEECNCWKYFKNKIDSNGIFVKPGIFFFKENNRGYYLVNFPLYRKTDTIQVFIELFPLMLEKTQDYPNLLVDRNSDVMIISSFVSYALYDNGELSYSKGQFVFPFRIDTSWLMTDTAKFVETKTHYMFNVKTDQGSDLLLIGEKMGFNHMWTGFSFVFLLSIFYTFFVFLFIPSFSFLSPSDKGLSTRFQRMLLWFILVSFSISVFFSVQNLLRISHRKNQELLHEKGQNLKLELEAMIASDSTLFNADWLTSFVLNYGYKNHVDINLYNWEGKLLTTTRPELYERNLIAPYIDPTVFEKLKEHVSPYVIRREKIEKLGYYSAYYPLYDRNYHVMGFIQVPYFTREQQFNEELFSYISSMVNLYLIIIFLGVILVYVLTKPILRPLSLIKNRMRTIRLSGVNEKITWEGQDEIADLIEAYNSMVDELALKAQQLAENERELAWRDMARQVAHEIKNPLTPMKLSTQYIWKLWVDKDKDFSSKFENYIKSLQKQIDSLDNIASSFSSLGKLVQPDQSQKTSVHDLVQDVVTLFLSDEYDLRVSLPEKKCWIIGDYQHWRQVLINLLKNAVQALVEERRGEISINVSCLNDQVCIAIQDNGRGMSKEEMSRIFQPNFTTKTSGSGLGLAIAKTIVEMYGGKIVCESQLHVGSCFTLILKTNS
ncbi:MAG: HAMP domain-containing histidine kinase [Bacteroidales bacterium]|nr:HAMP domain-containing histidine kinase [Bacteroidales bacterium]